jgi:transposase
MNTRIIGIDLAVTAAHKAIVLDCASNEFVSPLFTFHTDPAELDRVLAAARAGTTEPLRLQAALEATAMSWYPVGQYLERRGVEVYRVNGQQVADLRRVYKRHAKSDRIDARVLAQLPLVASGSLHRCYFPSAQILTLQRTCREVARLKAEVTATKNRILATDKLAWLGLPEVVPPFSTTAYWLRENWYNPWQVQAAGVEELTKSWLAIEPDDLVDPVWITALLHKAERVVRLYGHEEPFDFASLQASLQRGQQRLREAEEQAHELRLHTVRPLYRQLHPQRHLETLRGVGQDSAAIYLAFIGDYQRFPSVRDFLGWSGMIPFSRQSGEVEAKGLRITKAGPNLVKAAAFLNASVARLWDPQIAALYYHQMVDLGKHHLQATCACATHLLTRVYAILREDRPYELRDVDGTPVDKRIARRICQERYRVPEEVRIRNNRRVRRARQEARLEKRHKPRRRK